MSVSETMRQKLHVALEPAVLDIHDDSERHRGHGGWREGGETHFNLRIVSGAFAGKSHVARQRLVFDVLREEMQGRVHALSLRCLTPEEAEDTDS